MFFFWNTSPLTLEEVTVETQWVVKKHLKHGKVIYKCISSSYNCKKWLTYLAEVDYKCMSWVKMYFRNQKWCVFRWVFKVKSNVSFNAQFSRWRTEWLRECLSKLAVEFFWKWCVFIWVVRVKSSVNFNSQFSQ